MVVVKRRDNIDWLMVRENAIENLFSTVRFPTASLVSWPMKLTCLVAGCSIAPSALQIAAQMHVCKTYPSYNLQPLLLKRYRELEEARAFNNWLGERRQAQEGQRHLDDVSRLTEAVHRQVPQLRYARAERRGVERAAGEVAQQ